MKRITFAIAFAALAAGANEIAEPAPYGAVRLTGPIGARIDRMVKNDLAAVDMESIVAPFREKAERNHWWQTEFWGKYMHAASPFWTYSRDPALKAKIDAGVESMLASQEPSGYIGNYPDEMRCGAGWDVWGMKYTLMGLMHHYDATRDERAIAAARRLADYVIAELGPNGKRGVPVWRTGNWAGQPSSSILEPIMWLYFRTKDERYFDFAAWLVKGMTEDLADGMPRLLDLALKGVPVADRDLGAKTEKMTGYVVKARRIKAYEMMSCYQGLLEYWSETRRRGKPQDDLLRAAVATAESVVRDEINLAGGCCCHEMWFHGAEKQHLPYSRLQETCVTTTWMRFAEKLLQVTGEARWADELERTFYNAYLAAMRRDCSEFAAYTPLNGYRSSGMHHCFMHTNCCNANGPRGFLAFLRMLLCGRGDAAEMNFYSSGTFETAIPKTGAKVKFESYTLYPKVGYVRLVNHTPKGGRFALALRIPAWSAKTRVRVNREDVKDAPKAGTHFRLEREWREGDVVEIDFDMAVRKHAIGHNVAFTRGPVALVRATRFADGVLDEPFRHEILAAAAPQFALVRSPNDDTWMTFSAALPIGPHHENPDEGVRDLAVRFCDYASGANLWTPTDSCRLWFPVEYDRGE